MKLGLSGDYQQLVVKTIDTVHNHEVSEVTIVQLIRLQCGRLQIRGRHYLALTLSATSQLLSKQLVISYFYFSLTSIVLMFCIVSR